jgi:hypothetical protein
MPTFQAYFNGEKVAEFSGADPKGLENMIKRSAAPILHPAKVALFHAGCWCIHSGM